MSEVRVDGRFTFSEPVRAPFLNLFEARAIMKKGKPTGDPKFSSTLLIVPGSANAKGIQEKMAFVANAKWPGRALSELKFPVKLGDRLAEKATKKALAKGKSPEEAAKYGEFYKGMHVLEARTKNAPKINVLDGGKIIEITSATLIGQYKSKFYGGCFVAPQVAFVAYEGNKDEDDEEGGNIQDGVTGYLQSILWIKDGARIGGQDQAEVFKAYMGTVDPNFDPTGGDQIPMG